MYTKKTVLVVLSRLAALIGLTIGYMKVNFMQGVLLFGVALCFFYIIPWALCKIFLSKDEQNEIDGEVSLWSADGDKIEYIFSIKNPTSIPQKDYLKIKVSENTKEK